METVCEYSDDVLAEVGREWVVPRVADSDSDDTESLGLEDMTDTLYEEADMGESTWRGGRIHYEEGESTWGGRIQYEEADMGESIWRGGRILYDEADMGESIWRGGRIQYEEPDMGESTQRGRRIQYEEPDLGE